MNRCLLSLIILLSWTNIGWTEDNRKSAYNNPAIGISFYYPSTVKINNEQSIKNPLSIAFQYGEPPFAVHILFKEIPKYKNHETFIQEERVNQEQGGYRNEVTETQPNMGNNISAVRFVRKSPIGDMHYFVFQSPSSKKLYGFWHVTSRGADPKKKAVEALETMIRSLKVE